MCSGLLIASNTRWRGASNRRVIRISRSDGVVTVKVSLFAALLTAMFLLLRFELLPIGIEPIATLFPDRAIAVGPVGHLPERARLGPAGPRLRRPSSRDQSRSFEHAQVLRDGGETHVERLGQFGD